MSFLHIFTTHFFRLSLQLPQTFFLFLAYFSEVFDYGQTTLKYIKQEAGVVDYIQVASNSTVQK